MRYNLSMQVPFDLLSPAVLRSVIEEFVTRDGTDHSEMPRRVEAVMKQLVAGRIELYFDDATGSCNLITRRT